MDLSLTSGTRTIRPPHPSTSELPDQLERRVLVEEHHAVHGGQRGHQACALGLDNDGTVRPFAQTSRGGIAIHPHDQRVAFGARGFEQRDVTGMQQIEHAVGEDDLALCGAPGGRGRRRADLRGGVQSGCVALGLKVKV